MSNTCSKCSSRFEDGLFGQCNGCIRAKQADQIRASYDAHPKELSGWYRLDYFSEPVGLYEQSDDDIEYFRSKLYRALGIPKAYLNDKAPVRHTCNSNGDSFPVNTSSYTANPLHYDEE